MKVLLADEKIWITQGIRVYLENRGHEVVIAFDAFDAIAAVRNQPFDVGFVDSLIPGKNAFELIAQLKVMQPDMRVFLISGLVRIEATAKQVGAEGAIAKPVDIHLLGCLVVNPQNQIRMQR